ncbi:MAG: CDP-diacylglycerol--glycerol-3-phosphate 3-phosphatidyltransferase [Holosporales bacterium]|jgi:cardiolipin synthase|nr:CDP-diacylglycerol--glycerol-3-phosphate 3-phosphatidyltransferase [Holosporales bacterium]
MERQIRKALLFSWKVASVYAAQKNAGVVMERLLPNILTVARMVAVPLMVVLFYLDAPWANLLKVILFCLACTTDFFDGYLARRWLQVSEFGRTFDPVADKLLVSATLLMLAGTHVLSGLTLVPAAVILCREVLVSGLREFLSQNATRLPVTRCAKGKTVAQLLSIFLLLVAHSYPEWKSVLFLGKTSLWIAACLTIATGAQYFRSALPFLRL